MLHVYKTGIIHSLPLQAVPKYSKRPARLASAFVEYDGPLTHGVGRFDAAVVALHDRLRLKALEIAARPKHSVGFTKEGALVGNTAHYLTDVHVVE